MSISDDELKQILQSVQASRPEKKIYKQPGMQASKHGRNIHFSKSLRVDQASDAPTVEEHEHIRSERREIVQLIIDDLKTHGANELSIGVANAVQKTISGEQFTQVDSNSLSQWNRFLSSLAAHEKDAMFVLTHDLYEQYKNSLITGEHVEASEDTKALILFISHYNLLNAPAQQQGAKTPRSGGQYRDPAKKDIPITESEEVEMLESMHRAKLAKHSTFVPVRQQQLDTLMSDLLELEVELRQLQTGQQSDMNYSDDGELSRILLGRTASDIKEEISSIERQIEVVHEQLEASQQAAEELQNLHAQEAAMRRAQIAVAESQECVQSSLGAAAAQSSSHFEGIRYIDSDDDEPPVVGICSVKDADTFAVDDSNDDIPPVLHALYFGGQGQPDSDIDGNDFSEDESQGLSTTDDIDSTDLARSTTALVTPMYKHALSGKPPLAPTSSTSTHTVMDSAHMLPVPLPGAPKENPLAPSKSNMDGVTGARNPLRLVNT